MIHLTEYCHYLGLRRLIRSLIWINRKVGVLQGILREQGSVINIMNMIQ